MLAQILGKHDHQQPPPELGDIPTPVLVIIALYGIASLVGLVTLLVAVWSNDQQSRGTRRLYFSGVAAFAVAEVLEFAGGIANKLPVLALIIPAVLAAILIATAVRVYHWIPSSRLAGLA